MFSEAPYYTQIPTLIEDQFIQVRKYEHIEGVQIYDSPGFQAKSPEVQSAEVFRAASIMKTVGILRGLFDNSYLKSKATFESEAEKDLQSVIATVSLLCEKLSCVFLVSEICPLVNAAIERLGEFSALFPIFAIIGLKVPFLALDRPGLTRTALIRDLRESGVIVRDPLDSVTKTQGYRLVAREARREPKEKEQSDRIKKGMRESEQRGVKLGNPIIAEVQRRAVWMNQMKQPSHATLSLIRKLRNDGKSLREIAKILNDHNIATPQNKRWYASSVKNYLVS